MNAAEQPPLTPNAALAVVGQHSMLCLGNPRNSLNPDVHTHAGPKQGADLTLSLTCAACAGCRKLQVVAKKLSVLE